MAKRTQQSTPQPAQLSPQQIRAVIPKLERPVRELKEIDVNALTEDDSANELEDIQRRVDATLIEIFSNNTADYHSYSIGRIDETPVVMFGGPTSIHERRPYIRKGLTSAVSTLQSAISILKERLEDSGETAAARVINAYRELDLHPEIARAASQLYSNGH